MRENINSTDDYSVLNTSLLNHFIMIVKKHELDFELNWDLKSYYIQNIFKNNCSTLVANEEQ